MANSGRTVEVLCPNGRRQKVPVQPAMTILQILQTVCQKQGFNENEYDLKHIKKVLPVASMLRYLNLSNNAKLEMVKCVKERKNSAAKVTVALQLEDGSRLQEEFNSTVTLKDMLMQFQSNNESKVLLTPGAVCVYMRNEYKGTSTLNSTSLQSMGITSGRAAIRLIIREGCEEEETSVCVSQEIKDHPSSTVDPSITEEPNLKKQKLDGVVASTTSSDSSSTIPSCSVFRAPPQQLFPDDVLTKPPELLADLPQVTEVLQASSNEESVNEFANFKFPESKPSNLEKDDEDDLAINPKLIKLEVKLSLACDRQPIAYRLVDNSSGERSLSSGEDVDDSFFQVTLDDLRNRMHDLKSRMNTEDLLLTQTSRHRKELEKVAHFDKIPIRFQFPDMRILQAFFRPLETVSSLKEFLRDHISKDIRKFELFTAPPKVVLKDNQQTLYKACLFPAALVYVSTHEKYAMYLKKEFEENLKTVDEAENVLQTQLGRSTTTTSKKTATDATSRSSTTVSTTPFRSPPATSSQTNRSSGKVPKWFKTAS